MIDFLDFNLTNYLDTIAAQYRARGFDIFYLPFVYAADFLPIVAGTTATQIVTIDQGADFVWCYQTFACFTVAGVATGSPDMTCRVTVDSSQRQIMSQAIHLTSFFGTGQRPHRLFKPVVLTAKSSMTVEVTNGTAANQNLRLSFAGVKAFLTRTT
jgi:hypothetical protein